MKKVLKIILWVVVIIVVLVGGLLAFLSVTEYKPDDVETASVSSSGEATAALAPGDELTVMSWNTGYACLDRDETFIMDGGTGSGSADDETVAANMAGITNLLSSTDADIYILQEVDEDSARSGRVDQRAAYLESIASVRSLGLDSSYAYNYSCPFVPYPWPPMGRINSGIETISALPIASAERMSLPCPFDWPLRTANLKRCLLASYFELEGTDAQLVVVNLHLEAYDDGAGKAAQTKQLVEFMESEYEKGNYVIAGGDFNQTFPGCLDVWVFDSVDEWEPGILSEEDLPEGFAFAFDSGVATCRSLAEVYDGREGFQLYVIDGFILSPNVELVSVEGIDAGFEHSDHNPVLLSVRLGEPAEA